VGRSAYRRIFEFWFFISHHNCQLPSTPDAAECMQNRGPGVRVVHRADMPSGFRFRAVERAEFCFAVDLREMKIPTSIKDCQVSVRDCTARLTGDQPDELKLAESKEHSIAHTTKEASVEVAQTWASRKPEHTCLLFPCPRQTCPKGRLQTAHLHVKSTDGGEVCSRGVVLRFKVPNA